MTRRGQITIGNTAGQSFRDGGLVVARHATRVNPSGVVERGFFVTRKWLADRDMWAKECWFEWEMDEIYPKIEGTDDGLA